MRFCLLGPVEVRAPDGRTVRLSRRQERHMLAILLLEAGVAVPVDRVCELLWDGEPPTQARPAIRSHAARIRAMLADARSDVELRFERGGYLLTAARSTIDAHQSRALVEAARATQDLDERDRLLRAALALWHGPALQDEESMATGLELGRHRDLLPELARLAGEDPLRERLAELHMLALHRVGRTADALDVYARVRASLADELGVDPGPPLRELHLAILRGQPLPAPLVAAPAAGVPAQLPADLVSFTGRADLVRRLDELLTGSGPATVLLSAVAGTAGIGKTTLAVHWAHRVRDRFPDGQLFVNLRGFDPGGCAMHPAEVIRRFLYALRVPSAQVPPGLDAQIDLYRSVLTGKRMLIVLDNARDADQVRPLLPGASTCRVVVTSRNDLTGLVATVGAHPVTLDLLTVEEARELLGRRLGADRVRRERAAIDEIIAGCARLPLALAIVAARAATCPQLSLGALAEQLRDGSVLDAVHGGDPSTDLRAVFSWSHQALGPEAARLLGLHPGPDLAVAAIASLADRTLAETTTLLAELTRAHLLIEHNAGRYRFHDLLRDYATELAQAHRDGAERQAARHRMLDHYLHSAHAASTVLYPGRDPISLSSPQPGAIVEGFANNQQALAWLSAEHSVLLAIIEQAATGSETHTWQLAWTLHTYLERSGFWHEWSVAWRAAVVATHRLGDRHAQARSLRSLAYAYTELGRYDDAAAELEHAVELSRTSGDRVGQAHAEYNIAILRERECRHAEALRHAQRALELYTAAEHPRGQARALNVIGWYHTLLGDHEQALTYCQEAMALFQALNDRDGEAATWDSVGHAHHHLGQHVRAIECYERALALCRDLGDRHNEADTLRHLGEVHAAAGDPRAATHAWSQATALLDDFDPPSADQVRARLALLHVNGPANPVANSNARA